MHNCLEELLLQTVIWSSVRRIQNTIGTVRSPEWSNVARVAESILSHADGGFTIEKPKRIASERILSKFSETARKTLVGDPKLGLGKSFEQAFRRCTVLNKERLESSLAIAVFKDAESDFKKAMDQIGRFPSGKTRSSTLVFTAVGPRSYLSNAQCVILARQMVDLVTKAVAAAPDLLEDENSVAGRSNAAPDALKIRRELSRRASLSPSIIEETTSFFSGKSNDDPKFFAQCSQLIETLLSENRELQSQIQNAYKSTDERPQRMEELSDVIQCNAHLISVQLARWAVKASKRLEETPVEILQSIGRQKPHVSADVTPEQSLVLNIASWLDATCSTPGITNELWSGFSKFASSIECPVDIGRVEDLDPDSEYVERRGDAPSSTVRTGVRFVDPLDNPSNTTGTSNTSDWIVTPKARVPWEFCVLLADVKRWASEHLNEPKRIVADCDDLLGQINRRRQFDEWLVHEIDQYERSLETKNETSPFWTLRTILLGLHVAAHEDGNGSDAALQLLDRFAIPDACGSSFRFEASDDAPAVSEFVPTSQSRDSLFALLGKFDGRMDFVIRWGDHNVKLPGRISIGLPSAWLETAPLLKTLHECHPTLKLLQEQSPAHREAFSSFMAAALDEKDSVTASRQIATDILNYCYANGSQEEREGKGLAGIARKMYRCLDKELDASPFPPVNTRLVPTWGTVPTADQVKLRFKIAKQPSLKLIQFGAMGSPAVVDAEAAESTIRWLSIPHTEDWPTPASEYRRDLESALWRQQREKPIEQLRSRTRKWLSTDEGHAWLNRVLPQALDEIFDGDRDRLTPIARITQVLIEEGCLQTAPAIDLGSKRLMVDIETLKDATHWIDNSAIVTGVPNGQVRLTSSIGDAVCQGELRFSEKDGAFAATFGAGDQNPNAVAAINKLRETLSDLPAEQQVFVRELYAWTATQTMNAELPLNPKVDVRKRDVYFDSVLSLANHALAEDCASDPAELAAAISDWISDCHGNAQLVPEDWQPNRIMTAEQFYGIEPEGIRFDDQLPPNSCILHAFGLGRKEKVGQTMRFRNTPSFSVVVGKRPHNYEGLRREIEANPAANAELLDRLNRWPNEISEGKSAEKLGLDFYVAFYEHMIEREEAERSPLHHAEQLLHEMMTKEFQFKIFRPKNRLEHPPHFIDAMGTASTSGEVEEILRPGLSKDGEMRIQAVVSLG